jgi:hypothetical protein
LDKLVVAVLWGRTWEESEARSNCENNKQDALALAFDLKSYENKINDDMKVEESKESNDGWMKKHQIFRKLDC